MLTPILAAIVTTKVLEFLVGVAGLAAVAWAVSHLLRSGE